MKNEVPLKGGLRLRSNLASGGDANRSRPESGKGTTAVVPTSSVILKHQITRPLSSVGEKPSHITKLGSSNNQSQKSLGKYAQMALNNSDLPDTDVNEINRKYGEQAAHSGLDSHYPTHDGRMQQQQQVILRPVSGKSNSNRYGNLDPTQQQQQ